MQKFFKVSVLVMFFVAAIFTTSFAQLPWTKDATNPVMSGGASGTWNRLVMMPNVLYNTDSSRYEMWYAGSPGSPLLRPYRIGFATSPDGISWTKHSGAVLTPTAGTWDETTVEGPMVLREYGTYKMWYTGWSPDTGGIGYATSPDGINWTKDTQNNPVMRAGAAAWEVGGSLYCTVIPDSGDYKMWYTGYNGAYNETNIGYATSVDGINWQKDTQNNPVLRIGTTGQWDNPKIIVPKVVFLNGLYHIWYTGGQIPNGTRDIGWATSDNGIHWNKYNNPSTTGTLYADSDPVLSATAGQWDGDRVETGTVMLDGDSLCMWYSGWVSYAPISIGRATAPIIIDGISVLNKNLPYDYILIQNYPNPFNPITNIEFSIPKSEFVTLRIYNLLGQEVATLVSDKLTPGNYKYEWDAGSLASGVYMYKIEAGSFTRTRKLILMK